MSFFLIPEIPKTINLATFTASHNPYPISDISTWSLNQYFILFFTHGIKIKSLQIQHKPTPIRMHFSQSHFSQSHPMAFPWYGPGVSGTRLIYNTGFSLNYSPTIFSLLHSVYQDDLLLKLSHKSDKLKC